MQKGTIITGMLVVAAAVGVFMQFSTSNGYKFSSNFLASPITEEERAYLGFVAEHGRQYGTKEEF